MNEPPLAIGMPLPSDWVPAPDGANVIEPERYEAFHHVHTGDRYRVTQDFGRSHVRLVGEPNRDARIAFPFFLFSGVLLALIGAALHQGRAARYVVGPIVIGGSLWMVRASLDGFSRTASVIRDAERILGVRSQDFTPEQITTEPIFDVVANTWPRWHDPFAFTSLALWLATAVAGIALVRPNRRWTVLTITAAAAVVAWASWTYFGIAELANRIVE